jgi:hypothetical protein
MKSSISMCSSGLWLLFVLRTRITLDGIPLRANIAASCPTVGRRYGGKPTSLPASSIDLQQLFFEPYCPRTDAGPGKMG